MPRRSLFVLIALMGVARAAHAVPTQQQLCESAMELASAKYAQCRLNAEAKYAKTLDVAKRTAAFGKCATVIANKFAKATYGYGGACAATELSSAFEDYLEQCSTDVVAAAGGAPLPNYLQDVAICNASLNTCNGNLATCTADLATAGTDLATCEGDLAACQALPPARLLKTGQTTAYGAGSDGDLQKGVAQNFVDNGDGTITDTSTGLMWEKKSDDGTIHDKDNTYSWSGASYLSTNVLDGTAASIFLAALNAGGGFAGHTDWRLPNRKELESLVNLEIVAPAPSTFGAFNTGCGVNSSGNLGCTATTCSCTVPGFYWSSSTYATYPEYGWAVAMSDGVVAAYIKNSNAYARAVRSGS